MSFDFSFSLKSPNKQFKQFKYGIPHLITAIPKLFGIKPCRSLSADFFLLLLKLLRFLSPPSPFLAKDGWSQNNKNKGVLK